MAEERLAYRVPEAGEAIGFSRAKMYELIAAGIVPSIRIGGSIRVPADALRNWIAQQLAEREGGGR
jgi:excisionase family DNA binding protein